ncbi:O-antigen ligase family protein [Henriciella sp. AS95]|uniref:O-antigen ligase family protein n=1 Tax=Henriciella sp. AS95 TaxID=3135782 RepID=UPI0031769274
MTIPRGISYAVVLAAAFILWTPVALAGTQGFSALLGLAAIPAVLFAPLKKVNKITIAVALIALWATVSSAWSEESSAIVGGTLTKGTFNIGAAAIRIALTALAGVLVISAALRIKPSGDRIALFVMLGCLIIHAAWTLAMAFAPDWILSLYAPFSDVEKEAPQNMLRSTNAFLLGLPILLGAVCALPDKVHLPSIVAILLASVIVFVMIGSDVAWIGVVLVAVAIGLVIVAARTGFKVLFASISAFIFLSPLVLGVGGAAISNAGVPLPSSVQSRVWAWQLTTEKIAERPITGHGIEASKEWRETFGDRPVLLKQMVARTGIDDGRWSVYRILPGHPHNMGLQIWAETGLIGVMLSIGLLLLIGWSLPAPASMPLSSRIATASLTAASFALFSLSYSVWNEAFWATVVLAAAGVILLHKRVGEP